MKDNVWSGLRDEKSIIRMVIVEVPINKWLQQIGEI